MINKLYERRKKNNLMTKCDVIKKVPEEGVSMRSVSVASDGSMMVAANNKVKYFVFMHLSKKKRKRAKENLCFF